LAFLDAELVDCPSVELDLDAEVLSALCRIHAHFVDLCLQLSFLRFFNVTATVFGQVLVLIWHWLMENWSIVLV
jgi:hypothetical protein